MGLPYIEGIVGGTNGKQVSVRFLVDSGATYTLLPHDVWREINLSPKRSVTFTLADVQRPLDKFLNAISRCRRARRTRR